MRNRAVLMTGIVSALLIAGCGGTTTITGSKAPTTEATTRSGPSATSANLAVHGMTEANALDALGARANALARDGELSGAVLVAKNDNVLFSHAYGLADRKEGFRTPSTRAFASGR
jgi:CubicO group peptidase (beta-lactamase class C family)